ncbi:MAG: phosphopyruvate hydratase [Gammaproteobacteria bacterium]|mgnify:FL=1|jgi:enolase|nr:MAG: phosphopyruvate hydratase [Gammaproteobacteria bacterium TMED225]|tara:strand:- start:3366 stop:4640 length:1275 start_codon:yes stop_codon:yes gene_type:complete
MQKISSINAIQVFDSRGVPTISCKVVLDDGISASAMVPSGASTGSKEALELRDNDVSYNGKSVSKAVSNINDILSSLVIGKDPNNQKEIDESLILFDNTKDKSKFGANAILAISLAVAHVAAKANKISLYEHFSKVYKDITGDDVTHCMPLPMFNILNGGEHADNNIDIQEFMIIPSGAKNFVEVMQWATEIYHNLKKILLLNNHSTAVGDEGGFAPSLESNKEALKLIVDAIEETGLVPGKDVNIALDCAATEFYDGDNYILSGEHKKLSSEEFADYLVNLTKNYPIVSIEDGMDENDIDGWKILTDKLGSSCQLVGDDLFVTNKSILKESINEDMANSILIKFNQVGSITETIETIHFANKNNFESIISHRSGETEDTTIADLSVGLGIGQIKTGAPCRSDRVAKYNRLLWIEEESNNILLK